MSKLVGGDEQPMAKPSGAPSSDDPQSLPLLQPDNARAIEGPVAANDFHGDGQRAQIPAPQVHRTDLGEPITNQHAAIDNTITTSKWLIDLLKDDDLHSAALTIMRVVTFLAIASSALIIHFIVRESSQLDISWFLVIVLTIAEHALAAVDLVLLLLTLSTHLAAAFKEARESSNWSWPTLLAVGILMLLVIVSSLVEPGKNATMNLVGSGIEHTARPAAATLKHPASLPSGRSDDSVKITVQIGEGFGGRTAPRQIVRSADRRGRALGLASLTGSGHRRDRPDECQSPDLPKRTRLRTL